MRIDVITLFPGILDAFRSNRIWKNAEDARLVEFFAHDLRKFTSDAHHTVDDTPYGGGAGMVLKIEPLVAALESLPRLSGRKVLYASPAGRPLTQDVIRTWAALPQLVLISGRYEGVDERFIEGYVDDVFSVGDFVLSGGELPCAMLAEAVVRLIPGVVGNQESVTSDSFFSGGLKYPQYTRPAEFRGMKVPEVLMSGNHADIDEWRRARATERTESWLRRRDPRNSLN